MSLINDVLRNLEANRPDVLAAQNLQREVRSLPPAPPTRRGFRLSLLAALLLALGIAGWQWQERRQVLPPAPPPLAAVPVVVPPVPVAEPPVPLSENLILAQELLSLPVVETAVETVEAAGATLSPLPPPLAVAPPESAKIAGDTAKPELPPPAARSVEPAKIEKSPVIATPRDRADADWRRAESAFAGGRSDEGREALRAALRHDPAHVQARQVLLRHLLEARRIDEAVAVLQEGLELQPAQAGWAMSLARLQFEQGDLAAADRTLVRSQSFAENNADYAGFQGHIKSRLGAHRQAAAHYQRATRLVPNDGRWWLGYGLALESDGRLPEGREALRRALAAGNLTGELAAVAEQHLR
jgi:MSHA biogenesis protein MshN